MREPDVTVIVAQYGGECVADCGQPIRPGQQIMSVGEGSWQHIKCPESEDELAARQPRCARCGLNHPGEC